MDQPFESDVMDDLAAETPLSSADDDAYDEYDDLEDSYDDGEDAFASDLDGYGDSSDDLEDFSHPFDAAIHRELSTGFTPQGGTDGVVAAIADALTSPDSHGFMQRLSQNLQQLAGRASRPEPRSHHSGKRSGRSKAAVKAAAPTPVARVAGLAAQLTRQGADPTEALEAFLELAETDRANPTVVPVIAGLSLHQAVAPGTPGSRSQRQRLVQSVSRAAQTLAQKQGIPALAALPRILDVIERNAIANQLPQADLPGAIQRITRQVAADRDLVHRLTQPVHPPQRRPRPPRKSTPGSVQRLVFDRPVEISIRYL